MMEVSFLNSIYNPRTSIKGGMSTTTKCSIFIIMITFTKYSLIHSANMGDSKGIWKKG